MKAKQVAGIVLSAFFMMSLLARCANTPVAPRGVVNDFDGCNVRISAKIGPRGGFTKTRAMNKLVLEIRKDTIVMELDTFLVSGNVSKDYQLDYVNNWSARGMVFDENDSLTHCSGLEPVDVVAGEKLLSVPAVVANLQVGFVSIKGTKKATLFVDDILKDEVDIASVGETVVLSYPRLSASPDGISHQISVRVRGDIYGFTDTLLYGGDTTIIAKSGEEFQTPMSFWYMGPEGPEIVTRNLGVLIGVSGDMKLDGVLESYMIVYEPYVQSIKPDSLSNVKRALSFKLLGDNFEKTLQELDIESENPSLSSFCTKAFIVSDNGDTAEANIAPFGGMIGFRNADMVLKSETILDVYLVFKDGVSSTRVRCARIIGETKLGFKIRGTFASGKNYSEWSETVSAGN